MSTATGFCEIDRKIAGFSCRPEDENGPERFARRSVDPGTGDAGAVLGPDPGAEETAASIATRRAVDGDKPLLLRDNLFDVERDTPRVGALSDDVLDIRATAADEGEAVTIGAALRWSSGNVDTAKGPCSFDVGPGAR